MGGKTIGSEYFPCTVERVERLCGRPQEQVLREKWHWLVLWLVVFYVAASVHKEAYRKQHTKEVADIWVTSIRVVGLLPICSIGWFTLNAEVFRWVCHEFYPWWMLANQALRLVVSVWLNSQTVAGTIVMAVGKMLMFVLIAPTFGFGDALPHSIRTKFSKAIYWFLLGFYLFQVVTHTMDDRKRPIDWLPFFELDTVTIMKVTGTNIAIFAAKLLWNLYRKPQCYAVWRAPLMLTCKHCREPIEASLQHECNNGGERISHCISTLVDQPHEEEEEERPLSLGTVSIKQC